VPDGKYVAKVSLDAGPYLGVVEGENAITIKNPSIETLQRHIKELDSEVSDVKTDAARQISTYGLDATNAVPKLIALTSDGDAQVRSAACGALGSIRQETDAVVDALLSSIKDQDTSVRRAACRGLSAMREHGDKILPEAIKALSDTDPLVRRDAAYAVYAVGRKDATAATALRAALENEADASVKAIMTQLASHLDPETP
jgi:HEAT repeat protein